ncbi:hypothetical protein AB0O34_25980 [Sphaerisporangium sp. NPDC088356]|uniref:hypothetical protein n=1 Tax=Sphaerisporangium sp. NPDC088356 TaxID=3154871 RepID=UPI00343E1D6C
MSLTVVALRVRMLLPVAALAGGLVLSFWHPAHAAVPKVRDGSRVATDVVEYGCATTGTPLTQVVKVKVELTMPVAATTDQQMTIGWHGTYVDGFELKAPAEGLTDGLNLYAYASISGITKLTSATGVGTLGAVSAGEVIPLPTDVVGLKTTASNAGTGTVKPAAINFGPLPTTPSIKCEVHNPGDLTTYTLTVTGGGQTTTPTPTATSPRPTHTVTATETASATATETEPEAEAVGNTRVTKTPAGAAETGGGGDVGPDGRILVLTGSLLLLTATTGLLLRRRRG